MIKKELLHMRRLRATPKMIKIAQADIPKKVTINTYWGPREDTRREYQLYLRCCIEGDILKVALYYPDNLRAGGVCPPMKFLSTTAPGVLSPTTVSTTSGETPNWTGWIGRSMYRCTHAHGCLSLTRKPQRTI